MSLNFDLVERRLGLKTEIMDSSLVGMRAMDGERGMKWEVTADRRERNAAEAKRLKVEAAAKIRCEAVDAKRLGAEAKATKEGKTDTQVSA